MLVLVVALVVAMVFVVVAAVVMDLSPNANADSRDDGCY